MTGLAGVVAPPLFTEGWPPLGAAGMCAPSASSPPVGMSIGSFSIRMVPHHHLLFPSRAHFENQDHNHCAGLEPSYMLLRQCVLSMLHTASCRPHSCKADLDQTAASGGLNHSRTACYVQEWLACVAGVPAYSAACKLLS